MEGVDLEEVARAPAGAAGRALADALHERGWAVLRLGRDGAARVRGAYDATRAFMCRPLAERRSHKDLLDNGYQEVGDLLEAFQVKAGQTPDFKWPTSPPSMREALVDCYATLQRAGQATLVACAQRLGGDAPARLAELLDNPAATQVKANELSATAVRVCHYSRLDVKDSDDELSDHTDISLLTVAPRGTRPALLVKCLRTGDYLDVEAELGADEAVVFAGDMLACATANFFPAVLHRPCADTMRGESGPGVAHRLSMPFFMRARPQAVLHAPALRSPALDGPYARALPPLRVADLEDNLGGCRDRLPWKASGYYITFAYSE